MKKFNNPLENSPNTMNFLLKVVLFIAGYFLLLKPILKQFFNKNDNIDEAEAKKAAENIVKQYSTLTATKSPAEWRIIADTIFEDLKYSWISDDKDDATYQICRCKNDLDWALLNKEFGVRSETWFFLPSSDKTLTQFITSNLSDTLISKINWNFASKKMNTKF